MDEYLINIKCIEASDASDENRARWIPRARVEGEYYVFSISLPAMLTFWRDCASVRRIETGDVRTVPPAPPSPTQGKQLGDVVEEWIKTAQLDKLAHLYARLTAKPCKCPARKKWLNEHGEKIRQALKNWRPKRTT
jgi:hypothetical protein